MVFFDLIQVGPMFEIFLQQLEAEKGIRIPVDAIEREEVAYQDVFSILRSPHYLKEVPRVSLTYGLVYPFLPLIFLVSYFCWQFMNGRGTWDNIRLVITSLVLLNLQYIT